MVPRQQCAFIQFVNREDAEQASERTYNKLILQGRRLVIKWGKSQGKGDDKEKDGEHKDDAVTVPVVLQSVQSLPIALPPPPPMLPPGHMMPPRAPLGVAPAVPPPLAPPPFIVPSNLRPPPGFRPRMLPPQPLIPPGVAPPHIPPLRPPPNFYPHHHHH